MKLPGHNCGGCGFKKCDDFANKLKDSPLEIKKCTYLAIDNSSPVESEEISWVDIHGREIDFILTHFPEDPGPREVILPHNPMLTRELDIQDGDIIVGRPLGLSCGCPVTHVGVASNVDKKTGVFSWCTVGPLEARSKETKDIGYYSAQAYEGIVYATKAEIKIGMRYYFKPKMCMLQWRHSGLVNFINNAEDGTRVRIEGLWIG